MSIKEGEAKHMEYHDGFGKYTYEVDADNITRHYRMPNMF